MSNNTQTLNDTLDQMNLLNMLRTFHLNTFMYYPPLSLLISFILRAILSDIRIATTDFFHIFISSYFSLYVSLGLKWNSCKQHIYGSWFSFHQPVFLLLVVFNPFTFKVSIDIYVLIAISLFCICFVGHFLFLCFLHIEVLLIFFVKLVLWY